MATAGGGGDGRREGDSSDGNGERRGEEERKKEGRNQTPAPLPPLFWADYAWTFADEGEEQEKRRKEEEKGAECQELQVRLGSWRVEVEARKVGLGGAWEVKSR